MKKLLIATATAGALALTGSTAFAAGSAGIQQILVDMAVLNHAINASVKKADEDVAQQKGSFTSDPFEDGDNVPTIGEGFLSALTLNSTTGVISMTVSAADGTNANSELQGGVYTFTPLSVNGASYSSSITPAVEKIGSWSCSYTAANGKPSLEHFSDVNSNSIDLFKKFVPLAGDHNYLAMCSTAST